jgi:hypothetical protein
MNRSALAPAVTVLFCAVTVTAAFAQTNKAAAKPAAQATTTSQPAKAAPTTPAPPARAKWVAPIKGIATVDVIKGTPKRSGGDIVTVLKVKNTSSGSIALFRVDEYWYDKKQQVVSGDTQRWPKPFYPGDVIEITLKSPDKKECFMNTYNFAHANGGIKPTVVKAFK